MDWPIGPKWRDQNSELEQGKTMLEHVTLYASENTMGLSMGLTHDVLKFASDLQHKLLGKAITVKLVTIFVQIILFHIRLTLTSVFRCAQKYICLFLCYNFSAGT